MASSQGIANGREDASRDNREQRGDAKPNAAQGTRLIEPRSGISVPWIKVRSEARGGVEQAGTQGARLTETRPGEGEPTSAQGTRFIEPRSGTDAQDATKKAVQPCVPGGHTHSKDGMKFVAPAEPIMLADKSRPLRMVDCMCGSN